MKTLFAEPDLPSDDTGPMPYDDKRAVIAPYEQDLVACMYAGVQRWQEFRAAMPGLYSPLSPRTRANFIYDHIKYEVLRTFDRRDRIELNDERGYLTLTIDGRAELRFKKVNRRLLASNIQTAQHIERYGTYQMELPLQGLNPPAFRMTVGYQLNDIEEAIQQLVITYQVRRQLIWAFPLLGTVVEATPYVSPSVEQPKPRIKPKIKPKKAQNASGTTEKPDKDVLGPR